MTIPTPCRSHLYFPGLAVLAGMTLLPGMLGCKGGGGGEVIDPFPRNDLNPVVTDILPRSGPPGTIVRVIGQNLAGVTHVVFAPDLAATFHLVSDSEVKVTVPQEALTSPFQISTGSARALTPVFTVTAPLTAPAIASFAPTTARVYDQINMVGSGFTGATQVLFGTVAATQFHVDSDRELHVAVPAGAGDGPLTVVTPRGNGRSSADFQLDAGPSAAVVVAQLQPEAAPEGSVLRLTGSGFYAVTGAAFSGVAAPFTVLSSSSLLVTVPAGAPAGPITLTAADGSTAVSTMFTPQAGAALQPRFDAFSPNEAEPGDRVEIMGSNLGSVTEVWIGGKSAIFYALSESKLFAYVPSREEVNSGPILLHTPFGVLTHPQPLTLKAGAPVIISISPLAGPEGTPVLILGRNLDRLNQVAFGAKPATSFVAKSRSSITALVPLGASNGAVTVTTAGGTATSPSRFRVRARGVSSADVSISGMYITQAIQTLEGSVPLVAGRDGWLRVFLDCGEPGVEAPAVQVILSDAQGTVVLDQELHAQAATVPTELNPDNGRASWDLAIPGDLLKPGARLLAKVVPQPGKAPATPVQFPASGEPLALDIQEVAPIAIRIIPVKAGGRTGWVTGLGRTLDSWLLQIRKIYPFREINLTQGAEFQVSYALEDPYAMPMLRDALERRRLVENPDSRSYYYGVAVVPASNGTLGIGNWSSVGSNLERSAVGWDGTTRLSEWDQVGTFTHELGHNLLRRHSPCGGAGGPDPSYPHDEAKLGAPGVMGAFGFDVSAGKPVNPETYRDIMSYCAPRWISDFTFKGILADRRPELAFSQAVVASAGPGLLVSGHLIGGQVTLEPALEVAGQAQAPAAGDYTLRCLDGSGQVLQSVAFQPTTAADLAEGLDYRSFTFVVPMTAAMQASLAALEVVPTVASVDAKVQGPVPQAVSPTLVRAVRSEAAGAGQERAPQAVRWRPGEVYLSWDGRRYPLVMVKDPASGEVIAELRNGVGELVTEATELELNLSDGVRSVRTRVQVQP